MKPTMKYRRKIQSLKDLRDLALFYCSKRETSRSRLGLYLKRKCMGSDIDPTEWIESILTEFEKLKVIDDDRYAGMLVREYERRGKGKRYVQQKLSERGIRVESRSFETDPEQELERALQTAEKIWTKLIKPTLDNPEEYDSKAKYALKQKLLQKLVAQGYDFGVAKQACDTVINAIRDQP
jgi:SOS response regulatory protein OraA/RecX